MNAKLYSLNSPTKHLVLYGWLWSSVCGINAVLSDSVHLQSEVPKVDSSQPNGAKAHRKLHAEVHEAWLFSEMGFECSSTQPKTITKVFPGTQASLRGLQPGDHLIGFQQLGATAYIDVRRGKNMYRATITSEPKPPIVPVKPKAADSTDKIGSQSTQSQIQCYLIAECSLYSSMGDVGAYTGQPLEWCKQQMQRLDSKLAERFPSNLTFITYTSGGYSVYEHCSIEQVQRLWLSQSGTQSPHKSGDPLQDIINNYVKTYSPEERHKHKLIVAIVSPQVATTDMPQPGEKAGGIASAHTSATVTTHKLDPTDISITMLRLGNDSRAIKLNSDLYVVPEQSIKYVPFSNITEEGLLPALSQVFQGN